MVGVVANRAFYEMKATVFAVSFFEDDSRRRLAEVETIAVDVKRTAGIWRQRFQARKTRNNKQSKY